MDDARFQETRDYLLRHHQDAQQVALRTRETFAERHDVAFWTFWEQWMAPAIQAEKGLVLDFGTGQGLFLDALAERYPQLSCMGVECATYMLDPAPSTRHPIVVDDLHDPHLPVADQAADGVMMSLVLHELQQPMRALQEAYRCLKPGGRLCVIDLVRGPLQTYLDKRYRDEFGRFTQTHDAQSLAEVFTHFLEHNRFTEEDWLYLLQVNGFQVLSHILVGRGTRLLIAAERV